MLGFGFLGFGLSSEITDPESTSSRSAPRNLRAERRNFQELPQRRGPALS